MITVQEGQPNPPMLVTLTLNDGFDMFASQDPLQDQDGNLSPKALGILKSSKDGNILLPVKGEAGGGGVRLAIKPYDKFIPASEEEKRSHSVRRTFVVEKA